MFYIIENSALHILSYIDSAISSLADELERRVMLECQRQESNSTSSRPASVTNHRKPHYDKLRPNNDKIISRLAERCQWFKRHYILSIV